jgi:hypothetical protein
MERLVGFDRLESFVKRFAARAERFSGVEVGEGWPSTVAVFLTAAVLLSCPVVVGVYVVLALGFDLIPRLWLPLLVLLAFVAAMIWMTLAAVGSSVKPAEPSPETRSRRFVDVDERRSFSWTLWPRGSRTETRMSVAARDEMVQDAQESEEEAGAAASTLRERLSWAVLLSSVVPVIALTFLVLFPPFLLVWLLSRGIARLAEGLRTAAVLLGFLFFLSGLCLQLWATF